MKEDKFVRFIKFYTSLYAKGFQRISNVLAKINRLMFSCDIPSSVVIGSNFHLPHYGLGVVLHPKTTIGNDCVIYQNVTIGVKHRGDGEASFFIKDGALIGAGAVILGRGLMTIGANSVIGGGAVVLSSLPDNSIAVGNPARIING